jgi:hypothetical protein
MPLCTVPPVSKETLRKTKATLDAHCFSINIRGRVIAPLRVPTLKSASPHIDYP